MYKNFLKKKHIRNLNTQCIKQSIDLIISMSITRTTEYITSGLLLPVFGNLPMTRLCTCMYICTNQHWRYPLQTVLWSNMIGYGYPVQNELESMYMIWRYLCDIASSTRKSHSCKDRGYPHNKYSTRRRTPPVTSS